MSKIKLVKKFKLKDGTQLAIDSNGALRSFHEFRDYDGDKDAIVNAGYSREEAELGVLELNAEDLYEIASEADKVAEVVKLRSALNDALYEVGNNDIPSSTHGSTYEVELDEEFVESGFIKIGCKEVPLKMIQLVHRMSLAARKKRK